ncbi:hypothetical protein GX51_06276 [Blastomyces parvus]|uniref:Small ribosomal subunit protein uS7m n=1 Tax=Blastomyces parvus TaxID=2060905 RepID=A0A2B7WSG3_9EURO|nr:hypothetical protein GX51_06276 [Blastomyces parvus]
MPPRLNLLPTSLLRQSPGPQQCTAARFASPLSSGRDNAIRTLSTRRDLLLRRPGAVVLAYRPRVSSSQHRMGSSSSKSGDGLSEGKEERVADEKGAESTAAKEGLGSVSEEAADMARIMERRTECGEVGGPELLQGSMVGDILKRDKDALKNAPKVLRDQLSSSSSSSSSSGSRSFSTSARSRQFDMKQMSAGENDASVATVEDMLATATKQKQEQLMQAGLKYEVPETLPRSEHLRHRYDPLLDQFTKMLMRHGKLSVAQKQMEKILHNLRSAPAPNPDPSRPLLPGPPAPQLPLNPILYLTQVVDSVAPILRIKQQPGAAGGGRSLPIPLPLALRQRRRTAIKWIIDASEKRKDAALANRVSQEIIAVAEGKSSAWEKRAMVHKQGTAARANIKSQAVASSSSDRHDPSLHLERRNTGNSQHNNISTAPSGFRVRNGDESRSLQTQYQSLPSSTAASSVYTAAPAASNLSSSSSASSSSSSSFSSSSLESIHSSASLQQPPSLASPNYQQNNDISTQLREDDTPFVNCHLSSDSLAFPLYSGELGSHAQNINAATTAPTSPWLDLLEFDHNRSQDGQSLSSSLLLPAGTGLQTEAASTLLNPRSDAPVSAAIPEYDLPYPYSKGYELDFDESFLLTAQDSFATSTQPDTQYSLPDFNHQPSNVQQYFMSDLQNIHNQDITHLQCGVAIPPPSQSQLPTHQIQPKPYSPQPPILVTGTSPAPSIANTQHSTPSSTQTPRSPTAVAKATPADRVADKRRRNTLAARRFRQKQHDRVAELERALESVCRERDELKMQAARWEGEVVALRGMLQKKS